MEDLKNIIESLLFVSDTPLSIDRLKTILNDADGKEIRDTLHQLATEYENRNGAIYLCEVAGGFQIRTKSAYSEWIKLLLRPSPSRLSQPALETLAIIAYKQPIIRADIEAIRGVAVGEVIRSLMYKGLVKIAGRAEILGRPMLYGTTKKFLEVFGLNSLKDLPKVEELKNPDRG